MKNLISCKMCGSATVLRVVNQLISRDKLFIIDPVTKMKRFNNNVKALEDHEWEANKDFEHHNLAFKHLDKTIRCCTRCPYAESRVII